MLLEPFARVPHRPEAVFAPTLETTLADGRDVRVPLPIYRVTTAVVARPVSSAVTDTDAFVVDLSRWVLHDIVRERSTGLVVPDPTGLTAHRLADRYLREAAELSEDALGRWRQNLLAEHEQPTS